MLPVQFIVWGGLWSWQKTFLLPQILTTSNNSKLTFTSLLVKGGFCLYWLVHHKMRLIRVSTKKVSQCTVCSETVQQFFLKTFKSRCWKIIVFLINILDLRSQGGGLYSNHPLDSLEFSKVWKTPTTLKGYSSNLWRWFRCVLRGWKDRPWRKVRRRFSRTTQCSVPRRWGSTQGS